MQKIYFFFNNKIFRDIAKIFLAMTFSKLSIKNKKYLTFVKYLAKFLKFQVFF